MICAGYTRSGKDSMKFFPTCSPMSAPTKSLSLHIPNNATHCPMDVDCTGADADSKIGQAHNLDQSSKAHDQW